MFNYDREINNIYIWNKMIAFSIHSEVYPEAFTSNYDSPNSWKNYCVIFQCSRNTFYTNKDVYKKVDNCTVLNCSVKYNVSFFNQVLLYALFLAKQTRKVSLKIYTTSIGF